MALGVQVDQVDQVVQEGQTVQMGLEDLTAVNIILHCPVVPVHPAPQALLVDLVDLVVPEALGDQAAQAAREVQVKNKNFELLY